MGTIITKAAESAREPERIGQHRQWAGKITMSSSYATGGDTLNAAMFGLTRFMSSSHVLPAGGYVFELIPAADPTTAKVKAYRQTNPAAAGGADVPLVEVANAVDLSAITPQVVLKGR